MPAQRHLNTSHRNLKAMSKNAEAKATQDSTTFEHDKFKLHCLGELLNLSSVHIIHITATSLLRNKGSISSCLDLKGFHPEHLRKLWDVTSFCTALSDFYCAKTKIMGFSWDIICTASGNSASVVNYDKISLLLSC